MWETSFLVSSAAPMARPSFSAWAGYLSAETRGALPSCFSVVEVGADACGGEDCRVESCAFENAAQSREARAMVRVSCRRFMAHLGAQVDLGGQSQPTGWPYYRTIQC